MNEAPVPGLFQFSKNFMRKWWTTEHSFLWNFPYLCYIDTGSSNLLSLYNFKFSRSVFVQNLFSKQKLVGWFIEVNLKGSKKGEGFFPFSIPAISKYDFLSEKAWHGSLSKVILPSLSPLQCPSKYYSSKMSPLPV